MINPAMAYFLIGLVLGISGSVLLGLINKNSPEIVKMRQENVELKEANQALAAKLKASAINVPSRSVLSKPARPVGRGSRGQDEDSPFSR